jgi:hypothetical protein
MTFLPKTADDRVGIHAAFDELDRDPLLEGIVIAHGEEDGAHAAAADLFEDPVCADARAGGHLALKERGGGLLDHAVEGGFAAGIVGEKAFDVTAEV